MLVEWPELDPGWLFAQLLMKPIRVSTCLCHFHLICMCKPNAPIVAQLYRRRNKTGPPAASEEPITEPAPANPAHSDTLLCEKQHGQDRRLEGLYTHTPHVLHINCFIVELPSWINHPTSGDFKPAAPSWIRYAASPTRIRTHETPPVRFPRQTRFHRFLQENRAEEFGADAVNRWTLAPKD